MERKGTPRGSRAEAEAPSPRSCEQNANKIALAMEQDSG